MDNQSIISSGVIGGAVAAALTAIPFLNFINCFCCIGIMFGGAVALLYYDRSFQNQDMINAATAVTLGISSGLIGAFIAVMIEYFIYLNFGHWELEFIQDLINNLDEVPLVLEEMIREIEDDLSRGFLWGSILLQNIIIMPIFCLIGALITRAVLNRNRPLNLPE
jgi:hypothetical protein